MRICVLQKKKKNMHIFIRFLTESLFYWFSQEINKYLEKSKYLPKLNNEIPNQRNSTYKERFTSLHNLVLVKVPSPQIPYSFFINSNESSLDHSVLF